MFDSVRFGLGGRAGGTTSVLPPSETPLASLSLASPSSLSFLVRLQGLLGVDKSSVIDGFKGLSCCYSRCVIRTDRVTVPHTLRVEVESQDKRIFPSYGSSSAETHSHKKVP